MPYMAWLGKDNTSVIPKERQSNYTIKKLKKQKGDIYHDNTS